MSVKDKRGREWNGTERNALSCVFVCYIHAHLHLHAHLDESVLTVQPDDQIRIEYKLRHVPPIDEFTWWSSENFEEQLFCPFILESVTLLRSFFLCTKKSPKQ